MMIGANRLGKTDWLTDDFSLYAMGRHPYHKTPRNARLWIVVLKNDMVDSALLPKFKEKLQPGKWEYNDNKKTFFVRCGHQNWSEINIKSQEAGRGSFESAKVHRLAFDEQPEEEIFDSAQIRIIDTKAQTLMAATPWEQGVSWVIDRFIQPFLDAKMQGKEHPDVEFVGGSQEQNITLDPKVINEKMRQMMLKNPEEARVRFGGEFVPVSGRCPFNLTALLKARDEAKTGLRFNLSPI